MTYYQDLTPYEYSPDPLVDPRPLNVGWLSREMPFEKGVTSQQFKDRLLEFCSDELVINIMRGFHACEFCNLSYEQWADKRNKPGEKNHWASIGDGEIRVLGKSAVYAAPSLIYHYVIDHQYKPPDEFVEAVLTGTSPGSNEHRDLLGKYR